MYKRVLFTIAAFTIAMGPVSAQQFQQRARITGGGNGGSGKCTIEVVVDGSAEVEVRGDRGMLRNLAGQPPQWRRFECTGVMPPNPGNFRFRGVDGRGNVQLVRDPRNGGSAVVRIEDREGGAEGYTFDLEWGGDDGGGGGRFGPNGGYPGPAGGPGPGRRWTTEQAIQGCREAVASQISDRFRTNNVVFHDVRIDDNPGRNDWVIGRVDVRRYNREERYRFSCSVNFNNGNIRSADVQPLEGYRERGGGGYDDGGGMASGRAMENCRQAVRDRLRSEGYDAVQLPSINVDDRPGRRDWIVGTARASRGMRGDTFNFSCSVDMNRGEVRNVDVTRR